MHNQVREAIETEVQTSMEDYGDLLVQNISTRVLVPAGNLPGALPINAVIGRHDAMGAVDRYGADEGVLLAQKLRSFEAALHGTFTAEATAEVEYVLGFSGEEIPVTDRPNLEDGISPSTEIGAADGIDNDVLYHVAGTFEAGHRDTASGTAASATPFRVSDETNYLNEVGVLPEVSARDTLFENLVVGSDTSETPEDGPIVVTSSWQLYYLETDDEIEGRQIELP